MEGLEDELTCPVCLELYTCPLLLPCHHNLCRRCAEAFLEAPAGEPEPEGTQAACFSEPAPPSPEDTPGSFACPTCREEVHLGDRGVDGLRRNLLLQNIIDRFKHAQSQLKRDAVPCLVCDAAPPRDAVKSCSTCKLSYCRECLPLVHPSRGVMANHQLVAPMESFDTMQKAVMCPEHKNKPVDLYCMEDNTPVCSLCKLVGKHKEHHVSALEEVFEGKKQDLQDVVQEMEGNMEEEATKIKELETKKAAIENHGAQLKSKIHTECNALINIIREREVAMVAEVDGVVKYDTTKIQTFIDSSKEKVKSASSCLAYAKEAVKETDPACFLQSEQLVSGRVKQSNSAFVDDEEHTRIPADRVSVNLSSVKRLLKGLDLPRAPVISQENCSATARDVTVTWDADGQDSNSKFNVLCCCLDDNPASMGIHEIQQNSCTVMGLKADTSYSVTVVSKTDGGTAKSDSFPMKTARDQLTPIATPVQSVTVSAFGSYNPVWPAVSHSAMLQSAAPAFPSSELPSSAVPRALSALSSSAVPRAQSALPSSAVPRAQSALPSSAVPRAQSALSSPGFNPPSLNPPALPLPAAPAFPQSALPPELPYVYRFGTQHNQ